MVYQNVLRYLNTAFTILFTIECILKLMGFGIRVRPSHYKAIFSNPCWENGASMDIFNQYYLTVTLTPHLKGFHYTNATVKHHFSGESGRYGVSSPLWDWVFRTRPDPR